MADPGWLPPFPVSAPTLLVPSSKSEASNNHGRGQVIRRSRRGRVADALVLRRVAHGDRTTRRRRAGYRKRGHDEVRTDAHVHVRDVVRLGGLRDDRVGVGVDHDVVTAGRQSRRQRQRRRLRARGAGASGARPAIPAACRWRRARCSSTGSIASSRLTRLRRPGSSSSRSPRRCRRPPPPCVPLTAEMTRSGPIFTAVAMTLLVSTLSAFVLVESACDRM